MCYTTCFLLLYITDKGKGKGKSNEIPLQIWTGMEVSRKLMFPDFMTIGTRM